MRDLKLEIEKAELTQQELSHHGNKGVNHA